MPSTYVPYIQSKLLVSLGRNEIPNYVHLEYFLTNHIAQLMLKGAMVHCINSEKMQLLSPFHFQQHIFDLCSLASYVCTSCLLYYSQLEQINYDVCPICTLWSQSVWPTEECLFKLIIDNNSLFFKDFLLKSCLLNIISAFSMNAL